MKKAVHLSIALLVVVCVLISCDPIYPPGKLKIENINPLRQGSSTNIEIIYPNDGGSIVFGWKDQRVEILSGSDIVSVSDLTVTALKPGVASIKVSATTIISSEAAASGFEEKTYSVVTRITVK